jgi:ribonucleoside-diphosphate reductase alpha chain
MPETRAIPSVESTPRSTAKRGLTFQRYFSKPGVHPFDEVEWELRNAVISNEKGEKIFEQKDVEIPKFWSMTATNVVVSKYFHGPMGTPQRERSVKQIIERVARAYYNWGLKDGYFASTDDAQIFYEELCFLLVNQYMAFNSPVWFNVGVEETRNARHASSTPSRIR